MYEAINKTYNGMGNQVLADADNVHATTLGKSQSPLSGWDKLGDKLYNSKICVPNV